jgi:hypothetical protein
MTSAPTRVRDSIAAVQRAHIVAEMRRTARENDGKPLGRVRFERATEIGQSDWIRYWSRFTDLQREADLVPNQLIAAYENVHLFEKLVALTRELGRYPTGLERRTKSLNDPDFPSHSAFGRLGRRDQLIASLLAYCADKPDYADVAALLQPLSESAATDRALQSTGDAAAEDPTDTKPGFVYLARGHPGEYKIGRTNLVDRRVSELGATSAVELVPLHEIKTDDAAGVETYWHRRFRDKRMRGEWFRLSPSEVKAFKRWKRI